MTMSCPDVMYGYYPYLYGRAAGPAARASSFASPFTAHQYDRFNVQSSQALPQELYGGGLAPGSLGHSSGGSVSSGGAHSPGSPPTHHPAARLHTKEEDLSVQGRSSTEVFPPQSDMQSSQALPQELYGGGLAPGSLGHSSGGSVSSGGAHSPGSPPAHHPAARLHTKEEDLSVQGRSSTEGAAAAGASSDSESEAGARGARAQYVSANCVVFTHYSGDVAAVVDEHFTRALSYADKTVAKESSPMSSRNFPASFWNSQWQPTPTAGVGVGVPGELYADPYHAHDPWTQHYQQYTAAAAHHHRAVHDYHAHHHNMAGYGGLLLPSARLPHHAQYAKGTMDWSASHSSRLHHEQSAHHASHHLDSAAYSSYPTMAGLEAQVQESSKDLYWF